MGNYYVSSDGRNNSLNILKNRYKSLAEDKLKYFLDLFPDLLKIANTSSNYSKYLRGFLVACEFFDKENAELKARLSHIESEHEKEKRVTDFYGNWSHWESVKGFPNMNCVFDLPQDNEYKDEITHEFTCGKFARQRIKERKEFNAN